MGKIISICNQKGGVGKTTTCVNLAASLGVLDKKVLVIDTDPQANATISFGFDSKNLNNPALQFMDFVSVIKNNTLQTKSPNVNLLPYFENFNFFKEVSKNSKFKKALNIVSSYYDFIIIDCTPFFKTKNIDILISSHSVIIPIQCDYFALEGLHKFLKTVRHVQKNLNTNLEIEGFLLTMFDKRINLSKKIANYIQSHFKELVFKTIINRNSKLTQAPSYGKSIIEYDISSLGAKDYLELANEIILKNKTASTQEIFEEKESVFNDKVFSKLTENNNSHSVIINDFFNKNKQENKSSSLLDFKELIGLNKHQVKNLLGLNGNSTENNIWSYKINDSTNFFQKKYLYVYFKDYTVTHFKKTRFKKKIPST